MTDKEYVENIKRFTSKKLIEKLEDFGCDPYYLDLWGVTLKEVQRRLDIPMKGADLPTIEVSEDCISREQVRAQLDYISYAEKDPITIAKRIIENAPSVMPNRPQGEWIDCDSDSIFVGLNIYDDIRCSICGMEFTVDAERKADIGFTTEDLSYCPNCGARMKGADDE